MTDSGASSTDASLFDDIQRLYPLACILVGHDRADGLLVRVAERAAEWPADEQPDDRSTQLVELLLEEREHAPDEPIDSSLPAAGPHADTTLPDDVAREQLAEAIPVALAACSPHERFQLAADVLGAANEGRPVEITPTQDNGTEDAETQHTDAWSAFRSHLNDALSPAARALVDQYLEPGAVAQILREVLVDRYPPMPSSVRVRVRSTLEEAQRKQTNTAKSSAEPPRSDDRTSGRVWSRARSLLAGLVLLAILVVGGIGVYWWTAPPNSDGATSLTAFSFQHVQAVEPALNTQRPEQAQSFIETHWSRRLSLPSVSNAELQGVGRLELAGGAPVPVLLFSDSSDSGRIAVFAYSYALVDSLSPETSLDTNERRKLAERRRLISHEANAHSGLLWRDADDIFVAVAPSLSLDELRQRITP